MSENEMIHETATSEMAGRAGGVREPGPQRAQPQVLARVPTLGSAEAEAEREIPAPRGEGRVLSSPLSFKILLGAGAVLVVAAVVPLLFGNMFSSDSSSSGEKPSAWQPEPPAPGADVAPKWDGPTGRPSNWPAGPNLPNLPTAERPADLAWDGQADGAGSAGLSYRAAWNEQPQQSPAGSQAPRASWDGQPQGPPVAADQDPSAGWNEQPRTPSWQAPEYGQPEPTRSEGSPWADATRSPAGPVGPRQIAPPQTDPGFQPGTEAAPSTYTPPRYEATRPAPAATPAYGSNYGQGSQPVYRAADARSGARAVASRYGTQVDSRYGTQADSRYRTQADPRYGAEYPNSYPTTGYSPTDPYVPTSPVPDHRAGASSQGLQPGAAQFEGVIERPNSGTTYDRARSSVY